MKILQIIQTPELRGAEIFACQLSVELQKRGHHVDVLYLFPNKTFDLTFDLNFTSLDATKKKRFRDFGAYRRLADLIRRENYDLVQANAADTLKYAVFSKLIHRWKAPLVYRNANTMTSLIDSSFKKIFNRFLLDQVQYVISVSDTSRDDITGFHPRLKSRCIAIPIGTYTFEDISPIQERSEQTIVINSSSFVREKNHLFLIRLFKKFSILQPNSVLWLVGDGPLRPKIEALINELNLQGQVLLWGYRKDVISILKAADLVLMPSVIEGLPGAILEAFSCRVPVVASAVGGIPEVVVNGVTGFCINSGDEDDYVRAMAAIVSNAALRSRIVKGAENIIADHYLMPKIAHRFEQAYSKLVASEKV